MIELHIGRQTFNFDCGAKALQIVMAYYGVDVREDELMEALGTGEEGTPVSGMIEVPKDYGFKVKAGENWQLVDIKTFVDKRNPVIVLLQAWADRYMTLQDWRRDYYDGHYVILIGHAKGVLLFEDPSSFRRTWLREREFMARWHDLDLKTNTRYEQFAMVLLGKEPIAKTAEHMD